MSTLDQEIIEGIAAGLIEAERERRPVEPLTNEHPGLTPSDAYAIQARITAQHLARGERILGWKLGLTSQAMQQQLGVDQPDYGPILSGWYLEDGATLRTDELIAPRVEVEVAFRLRAPLRGPGVTDSDVLAATDGVTVGLEVIDSRIRDWRIGFVDTIADLASTARVIVAQKLLPLDGSFDIRELACRLERDGESVVDGRASAVLGSPLTAVAWAANTLGPLGVTLEAGQVVLTGAMHASVPLTAGSTYRGVVDRLGSVTLVTT